MFRRDFAFFGECKSLQFFIINCMMKRTLSSEGETSISYITNTSYLRWMGNNFFIKIDQQ